MNCDDARKLPVVIQTNLITMDEINRIHKIGKQKTDMNKDTGYNSLNANGHSVTFLQHNGLFEKSEPILLQKLIDIMKQTDTNNWKLIQTHINNPDDVNYRVVEYHHYIKNGGLTEKNHFDGGSIMTMVLMLSDPTKDFKGGQLMTWECNKTFKKYNLNQGDILIFPSHKFHSVSTVTEGERYVLVIELWEGQKGIDAHRTGGFSHLIPTMGYVF